MDRNAFDLVPYRSSVDRFADEHRILYSIKGLAPQNHVAAEFIPYEKDEDPLSGLYFIVCPDKRHFEEIECGDIRFLLEDKLRMSSNHMNPHYNIVPIPEVERSEIFRLHNDMVRAIQDVSLIKHCFHEYGYHIPKYVCKETLYSFSHFNNRRNNPAFSQTEREVYDRSMAHIVAEAYQMYTRDSLTPDAKIVPRDVKHEVEKDFFLKRSIPATYDIVTEDFYRFLEKHLHEYPDFIFFKETHPYLVIRNLDPSCKRKGSKEESRNLWKNQTGEKRYHIGFPTCQEHMFYGMMLQYNCRNYDGQQPVKTFMRRYPHVCERIIDARDMWNINSLCKANNVPYAVNYGERKPVGAGDVKYVTILIRQQDVDTFGDITARLSSERRSWIPVNMKMVEASNLHEPLYDNPFIRKGIDR